MIELRSEDGAYMDEVIGTNCTVHLERMDDHYFCLIIEDDERRVMLNVGSLDKPRHSVEALVYANESVK